MTSNPVTHDAPLPAAKAGIGILLSRLLDASVRRVSEPLSTLIAYASFRLHGCRVGHGLSVDGRLIVRTRSPGAVVIGNKFRIRSRQLSNLAGLNGPAVLCCFGTGR